MLVEESASASLEAEVEQASDVLPSVTDNSTTAAASFALAEAESPAIADIAPTRERATLRNADHFEAAPIENRDIAKNRIVPSLLATLKRGVIGVLTIVNYPLRFVPQSQRPMVDWIALSLVGWVPVVWILVFTLGHKNAHVQASAEVHEAGSVLASAPVEDKAMHETQPTEQHKDALAEQGH
jgi:hypothetical protein